MRQKVPSDPICMTFVFRAQGFASMSGPCCAARAQRCHWEADGWLRVCPLVAPIVRGDPGALYGVSLPWQPDGLKKPLLSCD